ncbi:MAG: type II toxin-antitoxin system VapC family toxin [Polyangiales bacterium]
MSRKNPSVSESPIAIDANVFIYAIAPTPRKGDAPSLAAMRLDSRTLIGAHARISISAVSLAEVYRGATPAEADAIEKVEGSVGVLQLDRRAVDKARELMKKRGLVAPKVCVQCHRDARTVQCTKCGVIRSVGDAWHDALIVASVIVDDAIDSLFTFDGGMLAMADFASQDGVKISRPPNANGDLFAHAAKKSER